MRFWPPFPEPCDYEDDFRRLNSRVNGVYDRLGIIMADIKSADKKLGRIMASQDDINAAVAALQNEESGVAATAADLQVAVTNIQNELASLQSQGVDTSALNAAVAGLSQPMSDLQAAQAAVDALETPAPPTG